jgi:UrcA family protein
MPESAGGLAGSVAEELSMKHLSTLSLAVLSAGVAVFGAMPAAAQNFGRDDIVVYGHQPIRDYVDSVSQRVSYRDLHLEYPEDRRELRRRVSVTAQELCDSLGDRGYGSSYAPSCTETATRDAMRQVRIVESRYTQRPRYYADTAHVWLPERQWSVEEEYSTRR